MKTEFKVKLLHYIAKKRKEDGFTVIELLIVIIITGVLFSIALPSFLNQANKAKQSEAKAYIGSMNKAHQAYFVENTTFTTNIEALGIGVTTTPTNNYKYEVYSNAENKNVLSKGVSQNPSALNSYGGTVFVVDAGDNSTLRSILCETTSPGANTLQHDHTDCSQGSMKPIGGS
ncbi:MAG: type IV pilin-like G/H family protein [Trichodesmium sp. MAG_R03]|nr:type IV pilin-like G/H family protein [Trichodesmium sp. MAG_R03]